MDNEIKAVESPEKGQCNWNDNGKPPSYITEGKKGVFIFNLTSDPTESHPLQDNSLKLKYTQMLDKFKASTLHSAQTESLCAAPNTTTATVSTPTAGADSQCYFLEGFDARGVNNTSWDGPGGNGCTSGPNSKQPCTKEDCCQKCRDPTFKSPTTGLPCAFAIWNPTAASCFFKTHGAVLFPKEGDVTCCPPGEIGCPSSPPGGPWRLLPDFSDEFPARRDGSGMLPLNTTRWNTSPPSWGEWSWDPENVQVVEKVPDADRALLSPSEMPDGSGYAALTMRYDKHQSKGQGNTRTLYYKSAIIKSSLPEGVSFGRFEARIKGASRYPGVCPAFWAWRRGESYWTELDFVEMQEISPTPKPRPNSNQTTHVGVGKSE